MPDDVYDESVEDMQGDDTPSMTELIRRLDALTEREKRRTAVPDSPLMRRELDRGSLNIGPTQQYGESNIDFEQRSYGNEGYDISATDIEAGTDKPYIGKANLHPFVPVTMMGLSFVYGTMHNVKDKFGKFVESVKEDITEPKQLSNLIIMPRMARETMGEKKGEPSHTALTEATSALSYLTSPLAIPPNMVQAPLVYNRDTGTFAGNIGEIINESGYGAFRSMFPIYGDDPDYSMKITEKLFPGASPAFKAVSAVTIGLLADPGLVFTAGLATMTRFGTQINRALLRASRAPTRASLRRGLETMLKIENIPADKADELRVLVSKAETGDAAAMKALNEALDDPVTSQWVSNINNRAYDDALDEIGKIHGLERKDLIEAELPGAEEAFKKGIVETKVSEKLKEMREKGIYGKMYSTAGKRSYKAAREFVQTMELSKEQNARILQIAGERADWIIAKKAANEIDNLERLVAPKSQAELARTLADPEYASIIKQKAQDIIDGKSMWGDITPEVKKMINTYRQSGGGKTTLKEIAARAAKVELETLFDEQINKLWSPEQYLAASIANMKLQKKATELALLATHTNSSETVLAATKAVDLVTELAGHTFFIDEQWGQLGRTMQEIKNARSWLPNREARLLRYAGMQEAGTDVTALSKLHLYLKAEQQGRGASFLKRLYNLGEKTNDALFEVYVNNLISAIATHTLNLGSNTLNTVLWPMERFMTLFAGNATAFGEARQATEGILTGFRDAFFVYRDMAIQNKYIGRVTPQAAKDASAFRMLDLADKYPAEYLNPWGFIKDGKGEAVHEIDQILRHKRISAPNFGMRPDGVIGTGTNLIGTAVRIPGSAMKFQDSIFKMIGYNMGVKAQAYRSVAKARKLVGKDLKDKAAINKQMNKMIYNAKPKDLMAAGKEVADFVTLQTKLDKITGTIDKVMGMRVPAWLFPLRKTNINAIKQIAERSPAGYANVLYQMYKGDTVKAQSAAVRATLGSIGAITLANMLPDDRAVGSFDYHSDYGRKMLDLQYRPNTIRFFDTDYWFSYEEIPYLKGTIGLAADYRRAMSMLNARDPVEVSMMEELATAYAMPFVKMVMNQRWVFDIAKLMYYIEAVGEGSENVWSQMGRGSKRVLADLSIPYSAFMKEFNRNVLDNEVHIAQGYIDELKLRIPGMSKGMPGYTNIFGEPTVYPSDVPAGLYHVAKHYVSPVKINVPDKTLVGKELVRLPVGFPPITTHVNGVRLEPLYRNLIQKYTGEGVKGGPSLYEAMINVMSSMEYTIATDNGKAKMLEKVHSVYIRAAINYVTMLSRETEVRPDSLWNKVSAKRVWEQQQFGSLSMEAPVTSSDVFMP